MVIFRFIKEYIRWFLKGKPIRSDAEMAKIFIICEECPEFSRYAPGCDYGNCNVCGCNLSKTDKGLNKIAWSTTECPLKKWG